MELKMSEKKEMPDAENVVKAMSAVRGRQTGKISKFSPRNDTKVLNTLSCPNHRPRKKWRSVEKNGNNAESNGVVNLVSLAGTEFNSKSDVRVLAWESWAIT